MASIDFKQLRPKLTLADVISVLGRPGQLIHPDSPRGPCPLDCHSDPRCCRYSWQRGLWYCHRCERGSDALGLYAVARKLELFQAALELCVILGITVPWKPRAHARKSRNPRKRRKALAEGNDGVVE